jgi:peptidyl-prolyl cis-trans isomerase SurA
MFRIVSCLLTGLSLSVSAQTSQLNWDSLLSNGIAAQVEDRIITVEQVRREMTPIIPQLAREVRNQQEFDRRIDELAREILQNMIDRYLIVRAFRESKMQIPKSFLETELNDIIAREFDGNRSSFLESLRAQDKTIRDFRQELEENIIVSVMRSRERRSHSEVSPEQIEAFYRQNKIHFYQEESMHLRQIILMPLADESPDLMMQNARRIIADLENGADFAETARRFSQDEMRQRGGDWGWIRRSDIRRELSDVAFALEPGQFSQPVRLGNRIFILYSQARREEGIQSMNTVREQIEDAILGQVTREAQRQWLERLRRNAFIRFHI